MQIAAAAAAAASKSHHTDLANPIGLGSRSVVSRYEHATPAGDRVNDGFVAPLIIWALGQSSSSALGLWTASSSTQQAQTINKVLCRLTI